MTTRTLIFRSLRFHARAHLGAFLGAAVGSTVLVGALVVGDSVRWSLRTMALERLAGAHLVLTSGDRFFKQDLFDRVVSGGANAPASEGDWAGAVLLQLPGSVARQDASARANRVQVLGVDDRFLRSTARIEPDAVWLNEALAQQLNARTGDGLIVRVPRSSALSRDAIITPRDETTVALRLKVGGIVPTRLGNLSLNAGQVAPLNAFVQRGLLQEAVETEERANLLLLGFAHDSNQASKSVEALSAAQSRLRGVWSLADAELDLRVVNTATNDTAQKFIELSTRRVFLDPPVVRVVTSPSAGQPVTNRVEILTYLVNLIRIGERSTPYSMVTAAGPPYTPADLREDEIVLNEWLADDLQAKTGDLVSLTYYDPASGGQLTERTNSFRVRGVVRMEPPWSDRTLMPQFPGIDKAESTSDWDTAFPLVHRIRDQDEDYWRKHRGTPKAFVNLAAGQKMWSNRFGNLTSIRWPAPPGLPAENAREAVGQYLRANLDPAFVGLKFEPVRERALRGAEQSQDFGGLFLGFSFFLITAALLLMALLYQFGIEQRATEVGTLLALGFTPKRVRRLLLFEGGALALAGGALGALGGTYYARAMLHGLSTIWRDAVGAAALSYHAGPATLAAGLVAGAAVAWITMWFALRKQARRSARELLAEGAQERGWKMDEAGRRRGAGWLAASTTVGAAAVTIWALRNADAAGAGAFFGAGALLLMSGLAWAAAFLRRLRDSEAAAKLSLMGMGLRSATRRRRRSLATLGLLACGSFLIASIGVFRLDAVKDAGKRSSGTGGFALIGESALPVWQDLNTARGRDFHAINPRDMDGASVVAMRVRDGDEASCLNLNRAQQPRLLGVKPESLAERGAFTFTKVATGLPKASGWKLLNREIAHTDDLVIPAIGDANSIQWAMGKKVGDTLDYTDEQGRPFKVRIVGAVANSILQGSLLIDEAEFVRLFPNESGYRMFLIDAPPENLERVSAALTRALRDAGLELTPAARRLATFNAVQNTYLGTFQVLGGLGLLLGSVGLGVVVMRNVLERRGELALLLAVGFRPRAVKWLLVSEHGALLVAGLGIGVISAFVAVLPSLLSPAAKVPYASLAWTLVAVFFSGALWTWLATVAATRGRLVDALRNE